MISGKNAARLFRAQRLSFQRFCASPVQNAGGLIAIWNPINVCFGWYSFYFAIRAANFRSKRTLLHGQSTRAIICSRQPHNLVRKPRNPYSANLWGIDFELATDLAKKHLLNALRGRARKWISMRALACSVTTASSAFACRQSNQKQYVSESSTLRALSHRFTCHYDSHALLTVGRIPRLLGLLHRIHFL